MKEKIDQCKLKWHADRVDQHRAGLRVAPITVDLAITTSCTFKCEYCYAHTCQVQPDAVKWSWKMIRNTFKTFAEIGVKAVSFVSDGESTCHPNWVEAVLLAKEWGMDVALGTNGHLCDLVSLEKVLPHLTYLRFNVSAATSERYQQIHGVKSEVYEQVLQNIRTAVSIKRLHGHDVTIGLQTVFMPKYVDQLLPLCSLGKGLGVDYLTIKHCSDDEHGTLGVMYEDYGLTHGVLEKAERMGDEHYAVVVKWRKIHAGRTREYKRCLAPPLQLQISGSGLVAPCGMFFNGKYYNRHIGNLHDKSFKVLFKSKRYWEVMDDLASCRFDAQTMCGCQCLQDASNVYLDSIWDDPGVLQAPEAAAPGHINFV